MIMIITNDCFIYSRAQYIFGMLYVNFIFTNAIIYNYIKTQALKFLEHVSEY